MVVGFPFETTALSSLSVGTVVEGLLQISNQNGDRIILYAETSNGSLPNGYVTSVR
jgi:hypothetical protein